ncbi:hypothetical protein FB567DRAFT_529843 [Paraphoma chrysanthemicola]|uniref:Fe2OG dioxygenase domain-containing protein n=1 Tax=Paraphoma chrysanthemicola TaxID=798071 RepID=A0A8K0VX52_9PLEO|nr:hypothetical protein FB567DRAFT_529843 [Paraphoma chrysanthemicola]
MAVIVPSKSSDHTFSISNIISRFRSKRRPDSKNTGTQNHGKQPILDTRPPLIPSPLALVLPEHQHSLPTLGWTTITFPQPHDPAHHPAPNDTSPAPIPGPHPLQLAYEALFAASQAFFRLPDAEKAQWKHKLGSEEGWSKIRGEKEFITLRTLEYCPEILRGPAKTYWDLMGAYCDSALGRISTSLDLPDTELGGMRKFVGRCKNMPEQEEDKTATMLRLFRYEGWDAKVVAEPHSDLGLLSVVVGNVPGLEVRDGHGWFEVERQVAAAGMKGASLLVGRQLERLSNHRYGAGGHRVVSYGLPTVDSDERAALPEGDVGRYRFSIVFVLRADEPVMVDSDELETEVTGKWEEGIKGVTAGEMYEGIRRKHYNINIDVAEREKQRRGIEKAKANGKGSG